MLFLLDSGSTHTFVDEAFVQRTTRKAKTISLIQVKVANGQQLECNQMVPGLNRWIQEHTFETDTRVLKLRHMMLY